MRVAIASFMHESNTFAALPTRTEDFAVHEGQDIVNWYADTFHEVAGYIAGAAEYDFDLAPVITADATPAGAVTAEAYEHFTGRIVSGIQAVEGLDGVLLALHGAMVSEEFPHADAETARRVRAAVGPDVPIVVTHDYHANVPPELLEHATALVIYKTNPHIDQRERGLQAASILARTVRGEVQPTCAIAKPEVLYNIYYHNTSRPPMQPVMQDAIDLERDAAVLACSVAGGYQYADVPWMGPSVVTVVDADAAKARREADRLGLRIWEGRDGLLVYIPDPAAAVSQAISSSEYPVTLLEFGDNIGGGSAGDSTYVLEQLLAQGADGWVVTVWDPECAGACAAAGIGGAVELQVGGKTDDQHGPTLSVSGRVRTLHDGSYEETERRHGGGRYFSQGLAAAVEVGRTAPGKGGLLIVNETRAMPNTIHQIACMGIQPGQQKILVAKGAVAPRAAYEPVSARLIEVDSGGATAIHRPAGEYTRARQSLYEWTVG
ncbi:M81 family metallopeptidase [Candidatus Latescibacterota bacterium]